jgi:hypothetical protein
VIKPDAALRHGLPSYPKCRLHQDPSALPYRAIVPDDVDRAGAQLARRAADYAWRAQHLLKPGNYLDGLLADPSDAIGMWEPRVVLLADRGPSPELDEAIERLYAAYRERGAPEAADEIAAYARQRAASRV